MTENAFALHWTSFLTGQAAALALGVTTLGFIFTVYQLARIRRSAKVARDATETTKTVLRTADLRRAVDIAHVAGRQIMEAGASQVELPLVCGAITDWLAAYSRIYALTRAKQEHRSRFGRRSQAEDDPEGQIMDDQMEAAKVEVMAAREEAESVRRWRRYDLSKLRPLLVDFSSVTESRLIAADDKVLRSYG